MLGVAVPILITTITKDKDRSVVMATLQALNDMLKSIKGGVIEGKNHTEGLVTSLRGLFLQQVSARIFINPLPCEYEFTFWVVIKTLSN